METEDRQPNKSAQEKFKSYYVVWKLKDEATEIIGFDGLNRTMQYGNEKRK